jgi:hypothetical protein
MVAGDPPRRRIACGFLFLSEAVGVELTAFFFIIHKKPEEV